MVRPPLFCDFLRLAVTDYSQVHIFQRGRSDVVYSSASTFILQIARPIGPLRGYPIPPSLPINLRP